MSEVLSCACGGDVASGASPANAATSPCLPCSAPRPAHAHEHCCCGGGHSAPQEPDMAAVAQAASDTCALYRILNMDCPTEEALIRKKLSSLPGITGLEFNLMQRVLTVHHELASTESIERALRDIDMEPQRLEAGIPARSGDALPAASIPWKRLLLAGGLAALSEAAELFEMWRAQAAVTPPLPPGGWSLPEAVALLCALAAIAVSGLTTYRKGWLAIRNGNLNINALMSVAVTGAVCIGHFPEAAMVMVLFNLSEALEARAMERARNAIGELLALAPETALVQQADGTWKRMEASRIAPHSRVRVAPGEKIALDGRVLEGHSAVDQAPITGESLPVEKTAGDTVYAGTINTSGSFIMETTAPASASTLARIIEAVEKAQATRAPLQRLVDSFARYYTPAIFLLALLTAFLPPLLGLNGWADAVYMALVLLVIGCPCALVISTPVSIVSGLAAASRHGILIKGGVFLEKGRQLRQLALDKTGTLTCGRPRQTDFLACGTLPEAECRLLAASLAARSDHPVSRAIVAAASLPETALEEVEDFVAVLGQGIRGRIGGHELALGNRRMLAERKLLAPALEERITALEAAGKSVVALHADNEVMALFAVADTLRPESIEAVRELRELGIGTVMLTGDNPHTAEAIGRTAGVDDIHAQLLPEDKERIVRELGRKGPVGMAGDGINDAPALACAHIGFGMAAGGTDTAIETADVALMDDDLRKIPRFIRISRAVYRIIVQNIVLAVGVKALFLLLTFSGQTSMWLAVFADVGTSLIVVANGLRARRL